MFGEYQKKRSFKIHRQIREDTIKMNFREIGYASITSVEGGFCEHIEQELWSVIGNLKIS
jgi:hypothetical protein